MDIKAINKSIYDKSKTFLGQNTHWITGFFMAIISEAYVSFIVDSFRLSLAVAVLPVFLVTLNKKQSSIKVGVASAMSILVFRCMIYCISSRYTLGKAILESIPGALFYMLYGLLFQAVVPDKTQSDFRKMIPACIICDFVSNVLEFFFIAVVNSEQTYMMDYGYLLITAFVRMAVSIILLSFVRWYHWLLNKEEHEARYQSLYLMTTDLKNEIYFMKKNTEEIENVMNYAYRLCMQLREKNETEEIKQLALKIATEVHEIKKDYFRIIQGMEKQVVEQYEEKCMNCMDIFVILRSYASRVISDKKIAVRFYDSCYADFKTPYHYMLVTVLKNLVVNAIEAMESVGKSGEVYLIENRRDKEYEFIVKDTGPGIQSSNIDTIYEVGFSTKFDYKTGNINRGMGLASVKMIVEEKLEGKIALINNEGGATFRILIPRETLTGGTNEDIYN